MCGYTRRVCAFVNNNNRIKIYIEILTHKSGRYHRFFRLGVDINVAFYRQSADNTQRG